MGFPVLAGHCWPSDTPGVDDWEVYVGWGFEGKAVVEGVEAVVVDSRGPPNRTPSPMATAPPPPPPPQAYPSLAAGHTVHLLGVSLEDEDGLSERHIGSSTPCPGLVGSPAWSTGSSSYQCCAQYLSSSAA